MDTSANLTKAEYIIDKQEQLLGQYEKDSQKVKSLNAELTKNFDEEKSARISFQTECETLKRKYEGQMVEYDTIKAEKEAMRGEIETLKSTNENQKKEIENLQFKNANQMKVINQMKIDCESQKNEIEKLADECANHKTENTHLMHKFSEIGKLKRENLQLIDENENLKNKISENSNQRQECFKLKKDLSQAHRNLETLEHHYEKLSKEISIAKTKILSDRDMLFLNACKADVVLAKLSKIKNSMSEKELQQNNFPMNLFKNDDVIQTANYILKRDKKKNEYVITKLL